MAKKKETSEVAGTQVSLNVKEAKEFLRHMITNNQYLQNSGQKTVAVELISDAGIGKTSVVQQIAEEQGLNFVKLNLAQIEELGDLVGFPIRQFQVCKDEGDCVWVDENALHTYEAEGFKFTGKKRMSYCPPEWIAGKEEGGILLLDDWTRADQRFVQACMELIDKGEYISWKLPKNWHVILTSNPSDGEYQVNEIDDAQRTRFISIGLKFDKEEWASWAEQQGIDGRAINFLLLHPEIINRRVNPRSMVNFFNSISSIKDFEGQLPLIQMIGEGSVGPEVTSMFTMFIHNKLDKLVPPDFIMEKPFEQVKATLKSLIGEKDKYRADIASTLNTRVINYTVNYAKTNKVDKDLIDRVEELILENLFGGDLCYRMAVSLHASEGNKFKGIATRQKLTKYLMK